MEKFCIHRLDWHLNDARDTILLLVLIPFILFIGDSPKFELVYMLELYIKIYLVRYVIVKFNRIFISKELSKLDRKMCMWSSLAVGCSTAGALLLSSLVWPMIIMISGFIALAVIDLTAVSMLIRENIVSKVTKNTELLDLQHQHHHTWLNHRH